MAHNVWRNHAAVFAARKRCGGSRYEQSIVPRLEPQTKSRQKLLSDHNYIFHCASTEPYQQRERRGYACYAFVVLPRF
jgi:hypothetical protein